MPETPLEVPSNPLTEKAVAAAPFLMGWRLCLRALQQSDACGGYPTWFNDEVVCAGNSHHVFPYHVESALDYIQYARQTRDALILAIVLREDDRHVGNISLASIDNVSRSAEFSIVLGDRSVWGKGYGKEAGRLICNHGFYALNLNRIYCGTFEDNMAMMGLAQYLGMKQEGVRRQAAFKRGRYLDVLEYGVLRTEYEAFCFYETKARGSGVEQEPQVREHPSESA